MSTNREANLARAAGILEGAGLSADDLAAYLAGATISDAATDDAEAPTTPGQPTTVAGYVATLSQSLGGETARTYTTYWKVLCEGLVLPKSWSAEQVDQYLADARAINARRELGLDVPGNTAACRRTADNRVLLVDGFGDQPLTAVTQSQVMVLAKWVRLNVLAKAAARDRRRHAKGQPGCGWTGDNAVEHLVAAVRSLYTHAQDDRIVPHHVSPAARLAKPERGEPVEQTMSEAQLGDVWRSSAHSGEDPVLDGVLARFVWATATRMKGALALVLEHLDFDRQAVNLRQKGRHRLLEVPVPRSLLDELYGLAVSRGSHQPEDPVFRSARADRRTGEPHPALTRRHFNSWAARVRKENAWAERAQWSPYWLRHHAAAEVEDIGGRPVKARFLGHAPQVMSDRYGAATFEHVAWAQAVRTGEPHPLARKPPWI